MKREEIKDLSNEFVITENLVIVPFTCNVPYN